MSTKRDTQYAAKRRAAARKRNRELIRQIGTYMILAVLIVGTVSAVFIAQVGNTSSPPASNATPTATVSTALKQLVTQADQLVATGAYTDAVSYYAAYLQQVPTDADTHFKLGKTLVDPKNPSPNYPRGLAELQQALNINPSGTWAAEAQALLTQYQSASIATISALPTPTSGTSSTSTGTPPSNDSSTGDSTPKP
jgi:tetratricopeptide (TPR) repeat protein